MKYSREISERLRLVVRQHVCDDMGDYAVQGQVPSRSYVKYQNTKGPVTLSGISINSEDPEKLKARCEHLLEVHEDNVIKAVKGGKTKSLKKTLCRKKSKGERSLCNECDEQYYFFLLKEKGQLLPKNASFSLLTLSRTDCAHKAAAKAEDEEEREG